MYFGWAETLKHSYAYELHHALLIQHNSDIQIQAWLEPPNHLINYETRCVNRYTTWMTGGEHMIFDRNTGGKTSKIKWLIASNLTSSILKALQDLGSTRFTPRLQLQRQINYTKCLFPDIVSKAQNKGFEKTEDGFKS